MIIGIGSQLVGEENGTKIDPFFIITKLAKCSWAATLIRDLFNEPAASLIGDINNSLISYSYTAMAVAMSLIGDALDGLPF